MQVGELPVVDELFMHRKSRLLREQPWRQASNLQLLTQQVTNSIKVEAASAANQKRLAAEIKHENDKLDKEIAKEERYQEEDALQQTKGGCAATALQVENVELAVSVTTVLMVFVKHTESRGGKKTFVMTLWDDGPSVVPPSNFADTMVMREYYHATERGAVECACKYCAPGTLAECERLKHVAWHSKFRRFMALRDQVGCNDTSTLTVPQEKNLLNLLVSFWQKVDPEAPYFQLPNYAELEMARLLAASKTPCKKPRKDKVKVVGAAVDEAAVVAAKAVPLGPEQLVAATRKKPAQALEAAKQAILLAEPAVAAASRAPRARRKDQTAITKSKATAAVVHVVQPAMRCPRDLKARSSVKSDTYLLQQ